MSESWEAELYANGCIAPEWFVRDHIPRYADHYGVNLRGAYEAVLAEISALTEVRNENNRQMVATGLAHKMFRIYAKRGRLANVGERPLIVLDNALYNMKTEAKGQPNESTTCYDPLIPLVVGNFHTMDDPVPTRCVSPISIGRPNSEGELWLDEGITVDDYEVVKGCFSRLLELRTNGITPHLDDQMRHIYIPYNLGNAEHPYDPNDYHHNPVDYTGFATELKVAS